MWHTFSPINKPLDDRFRCGKVQKLESNKAVILHQFDSHSVPASLSCLPICPLFTIFQDSLSPITTPTGDVLGKEKASKLRCNWLRLEDLDQWFTPGVSSVYHVLQLPFWTRGDSWPLVAVFLNTHTKSTTFAPAQRGKEASPAAQLAALTIFISQRMFA